MDIDEMITPPKDQIIVTNKGTVICSLETLMKWTDNWFRVVELRNMLAKRKEATWSE